MRDDAKQAIADLEYWKSFEHNGWKCLGFTYRQYATFYKGDLSCEINWKVLECLGIEDGTRTI